MKKIFIKKTESPFICNFCKGEIINGALFCGNCGAQAKCKNCNIAIEIEANFCTNCGEKIISAVESTKAVNIFDFQQKGNSKTVKAKFTNEVGGYFAGLVNLVVSGHPLAPKNPFKNTPQLAPGKNAGITNNVQKEMLSNIQDAEVVNDYSEIVTKIFKENESGKLEIIDNRLKEKSKNDKMKRLVVIFLFARKLMGMESITREELNEIINREKLADGNYRNFMSKEGLRYFSLKENGSLSLLVGGEDYAKEILDQIANSDFKPTTSKAGRKSGKKSSSSSTESPNGQETRSTKSSSPSALEMCNTLIAEDYFSTKRKLNDVVEYCDQKKAYKFSPQNLQYALNRLIKNQILEREKNNTGQYEYSKK